MAGGRLIQSKDTRGEWTRYGYNVRGSIYTVTDPNGNVTVSGHDVRGNLVSYSTCQDHSENKCSTIYLSHYPDNTTPTLPPGDPLNDALVEVRDGRSDGKEDDSFLTTYVYDEDTGDLTTVTDPPGRTTVMAYTDGTGGIPAGLPVSTTGPDGARQTMEYASSGDLVATVDAAGRRVELTRDGHGRVIESTEITERYPAGLVTTYTYDKASRIETLTEPSVEDRITSLQHTARLTVTYDEDGRELTTTVADWTGGDASRTFERAYNSHGQLAWQEDALDRRTSYTYNAYGDVESRTTADGATTAYTYDSGGNRLTTTVVGWTGHPADPQPPADLLAESRAYDPAGRLASVTDAMGWQTQYSYTDNNLVASVVRYDPSTETAHAVAAYTYDGAGNVVESVTNDGATHTTAVLDPAGRVTSQTTDPAGVDRTTTYAYNLADDLVSYRTSDGSGAAQVDRLLDTAGRLLGEITYPAATGPVPVGRWRLDESSGTTAADSAGNSPLILPATGVSWSTDHGGSAVFDGTASVTAADPVIDTTRSFTVSAWVNADPAASESETAVSQDGQQQGIFLLGRSGGDWRFRMCVPTVDGACYQATSPAVAGTWVLLTGVYDQAAGRLRLYVNGAPQDDQPVQAIAGHRGPLRIGGGVVAGDENTDWIGSIDDVQVYQVALAAAQVQAVHAGTAPEDARVTRTSWAVDQRGLPMSQRDADGDVTDFDYDEAGRLAVTTYPDVNTETGGGTPVLAPVAESVAYNTFGEVVESMDANGRHTFAEYDLAGQPTEVWLPPYTPPGSSTPITPIERTVFDAMGRVTQTRDALDHATSYGYDQAGRTTSVTAPDGGVTIATYTLTGQLLSIVDPTGARVEATYDYLDHMRTRTEIVRQTGQAHTATFTYHPEGWLATAAAPGRAATTYTYNDVGELIHAADGTGNTVSASYDYAGRQTSTVRQHASCQPACPDLSTYTAAYDTAGRQVAAREYGPTGALLAETSVVYSADSLPLSVTNARDATTTFSYDALGRLTGMVEPVSATESITTSYGYDATGNLTRFTDGRGNPFVTSYNPWGLPESRIEPGGATFTTVYDAAGRPVQSLLPGGVSTTSTYDSAGRLTAMSGSGAEAVTADRSYGYDLAGRLTSLSGTGGTNTLTYDDRGLLTSVTGPSGDSSYGYTPDGLLASRVDAAGTTDYLYDEIGRLTRTTNAGAGLQLDYQYDTRSLVSQITHGGNGDKRLLTYDERDRLTTDELQTSAGALVGRITYGWDDNSNMIGKTTVGFAGSAVNTYTYDLSDRLTSWNDGSATEDYEYDPSGNRVVAGSRTFTYNARNQLELVSDGTSYTYTPRGTLATTTTPAGTVATESDAFGQVIRQYTSPTQFSDYTYDGLGRVLQAGFAYTGLGNDLAADPTGTYVRGPAADLVGVNNTYAWTDLHTDVVGQFTATAAALTGSTTASVKWRVPC